MNSHASKLQEGPTLTDLGPEIQGNEALQILATLYAEQEKGRLEICPQIFKDGYNVLIFPSVLGEGSGTYGELISLHAWATACLALLQHVHREYNRK